MCGTLVYNDEEGTNHTMTSTTIHTNEITTRECDAQTLIAQITKGILMSLGARDIVNLGDGIQFVAGGGRGNPRRKVIVKLQSNDLFCAEIVKINRDFTFVSEAVETDLFFDMLPEALLRMADEVWG